MKDYLRPAGIFRDLATDPMTKTAILIDCELAVDEFPQSMAKLSVRIMRLVALCDMDRLVPLFQSSVNV